MEIGQQLEKILELLEKIVELMERSKPVRGVSGLLWKALSDMVDVASDLATLAEHYEEHLEMIANRDIPKHWNPKTEEYDIEVSPEQSARDALVVGQREEECEEGHEDRPGPCWR